MKKFTAIVLFLVTCLPFSSQAANKANKDIHQYVQNLIDNAFSILRDDSLAKEQKVMKSRKLMEQNLDISWMAEFSLGRNKKNISASELNKFKNIYSKYVVKSYSQKIKEYKGEKILVKAVKSIGNQEYAVKTEIDSPRNNNSINVDFIVRKKTQGDKVSFFVFDIVTEGVSLITAQRSEFTSILSSRGTEVLIKILEEKTANKQ